MGAVGEYYRRANAADTDRAFAEAVPELAHSLSPLPRVAEDIPGALGEARGLAVVDGAVVERDVGAERIRGISEFLAGSLSDADTDTLAGDNAVVAVTLEAERVVGGRLAKEWLVAPEDGAWRLVWLGGRNSPRAVARQFFRRVRAADSLAALDGPVGELSHPESPLVNVAEYTPWLFGGVRRQQLVGTEVVAGDVGKRAIASGFGPFASWATREGIEAIAGENAVVAVTLRDDQLGVEEFTQRWLLAPDGGEWRLVWV